MRTANINDFRLGINTREPFLTGTNTYFCG